jgi:intergrase/recombinase
LNSYRAALQNDTFKPNSYNTTNNQYKNRPKDFRASNLNDIDWTLFKEWLTNRYSKNYVRVTLAYCKRYFSYLNDIRRIDLVKPTDKNNVIKSLAVLSKFLGHDNEFKAIMQSYGVKRYRTDSLQTFLSILKANDSDIINWYNTVLKQLKPNEQLYLRFLKHTGLRASEGLASFNLIIELSKTGKLSDYYDKELKVLCHFKYPKLFIRQTKNTFISFLSEEFVNEISNSKKIASYQTLRNKIVRHNDKTRISELRDYYGKFLVEHGVSRDEQDLLCGRIPISAFIKHYWSPKWEN